MGLFTPFFERLINAIDDVKDMDEDEAEDVSTSPETVDISMNAEIRAEALREMEASSQEDDLLDMLFRRAERSRNFPTSRPLTPDDVMRASSLPVESHTTPDTEQQDGIRFRKVHSWNAASSPGPSVNTLFANPNAPASATSWFENAAPHGILGQSADRIFIDDMNVNLSSQNLARAIDHQLLNNLNVMNPPDSNQILIPTVSTTSNQEYLQLESQFQDFASLVKELLDASTPEDYRVQSERVREFTDLILSTREVKEEPNVTARKSSSVEIELD